MFGSHKQRLILGDLEVARLELLAAEKTSLSQIKAIWKEKDDIDYDETYLEQPDLPYRWQDPLYMKMIHRYRNCQRRIAQFYHEIDCNNQRLLLAHLLPECMGRTDAAGEIVTFLAWTTNTLGYYDIQQLLSGGDADSKIQGELLQEWRRTPIAFFFGLLSESQETLLARYNEEEIDGWNAHLSKKFQQTDEQVEKEYACIPGAMEPFLFRGTMQWKPYDGNDMHTPTATVDYVLTKEGQRRFDLLGGHLSHTPEGKAFRESLTKDDFEMQQLLVQVNAVQGETEESYNAALNASKEAGIPPHHLDLINWHEELVEKALQDGLIQVEGKGHDAGNNKNNSEKETTGRPRLYVLTEKGRHCYDLLGEKQSATPEGKAFRAALTEEGWQVEQLLILASYEKGTPREIFSESLQFARKEGFPKIHLDMLSRLDELLEKAVREGLLAVVDDHGTEAE